jgi:RNA polymerase-interacting CarD/CdnL/TRCF family regulator
VAFVVKQWVVVRGRGLGCITKITPSQIDVREADLKPGEHSKFEIPASEADRAMRPVTSADEAQRLLGALAAHVATDSPDDVGDRSIRYRHASKSGELEDQLAALAQIYGRAEPEYPERQYQKLLERAVFGELGHVLGMSRKALQAKVRAQLLGEPAPRSLALADVSAELAATKLPSLAGHRPLGAFAIDRTVAIGEASADVTAPAQPGVWCAYVRMRDGEPIELVAAHRDVLAELAELAAEPAGTINSEGATVAVFDAEAADDEEFVDDVLSHGDGIVGQRCAVLNIGGDGSSAVLVGRRGDRAILVRVVTGD